MSYSICEFEDDTSNFDLCVYSEEAGNVDALSNIVAAFQMKFDIKEPWGIEFALTCTKPRAGEFGGGAMVVKDGQVASWINTGNWLSEQMNPNL